MNPAFVVPFSALDPTRERALPEAPESAGQRIAKARPNGDAAPPPDARPDRQASPPKKKRSKPKPGPKAGDKSPVAKTVGARARSAIRPAATTPKAERETPGVVRGVTGAARQVTDTRSRPEQLLPKNDRLRLLAEAEAHEPLPPETALWKRPNRSAGAPGLGRGR